MHAFVLIKVDSAKENNICDYLRKKTEVVDICVLFGEWDIIIKVKVETAQYLGEFVMKQIRNLTGVKMTSTLITAC